MRVADRTSNLLEALQNREQAYACIRVCSSRLTVRTSERSERLEALLAARKRNGKEKSKKTRKVKAHAFEICVSIHLSSAADVHYT